MPESLLLMPAPRQLTLETGQYLPADGRLIVLQVEDAQALLFTAQRIQQALRTHCQLDWELSAGGAIPAGRAGLVLEQSAQARIANQGYRLTISTEGIHLQAGDKAGLFYGACTLIQIVEQCGRSLPCLQVSDWPDFPVRGVMLDISRNRVPTHQTLFDLVERLAGWKINQLQLYFENAFAYQQHPEVWAGVSPLTGQDVLELDAYCRERFIELVPNQQSFGHLAPWLNLPRYKPLAEVADGFMTPWGYRQGSFSLSPVDPASLEFLHGLYAELLPHFSSHKFNVGCDETWDLGQGRSQAACTELGKERVYLNFLLQIFDEVRRFGRTPLFWGDIIHEHPELIPELPRDAVALEWGYEAEHPFDEHCARFAASGIPFYVCPGTSAWCSLAGRTDNMIRNLAGAAENGLKHGAIGYVNTDWGDYGHWQVWPVSYAGLMLSAAYGWCLQANQALDLPRSLSRHAFHDAGGESGRLALELGNVYRTIGIEPHNSSVLFWVMQWPLEQIRSYPGLEAAAFEQARQAIEAVAGLSDTARMDRADADLIQAEFRITVHMLRHACSRGLLAFETDPLRAGGLCRELNDDLTRLIAEFRSVWLARNREGGLDESAARLEKLHADYGDANGGTR